MRDGSARMALWAMVPEMIPEVVAQGTIAGMVPDGVRGLLGMGAGVQAAAAPDPIRDGSTVIMPVRGTLSPRGQYGGAGDTGVLAQRVRELGQDQRVGLIVLDMSTPGGLIYGTQEAADAIFEVRQSKPVIAVANSWMVASAGYWLATQASSFFASPSADVGSVGVYGGHVDQSAFEQKIGMVTTLIASHPQKIEGHSFAPLDDEARSEMQVSVDESNRDFVAAIARGRGMNATAVPSVHGQGRLVSARRALEAGAIDGIMGLRDVVAKFGPGRARLSLMRRQAAVMEMAASI